MKRNIWLLAGLWESKKNLVFSFPCGFSLKAENKATKCTVPHDLDEFHDLDKIQINPKCIANM